jgi:hypothetical protein
MDVVDQINGVATVTGDVPVVDVTITKVEEIK